MTTYTGYIATARQEAVLDEARRVHKIRAAEGVDDAVSAYHVLYYRDEKDHPMPMVGLPLAHVERTMRQLATRGFLVRVRPGLYVPVDGS